MRLSDRTEEKHIIVILTISRRHTSLLLSIAFFLLTFVKLNLGTKDWASVVRHDQLPEV